MTRLLSNAFHFSVTLGAGRNLPGVLRLRALLVLAFTCSFAAAAHGQAQMQVGTPPAPRDIGSIEVEFIELENVNEEVVRLNMQSRPGDQYDEARIDSDIRALYRTGLFEYIEVKRDFRSDGEVDLLVQVRPKYRVSAVEFVGNERVSDRRLRREATIEPSMAFEEPRTRFLGLGRRRSDQTVVALDERVVRMDADAIHEFYQSRGFSEATVTHEIERDPETGFGRVTFHIHEGPRVRIVRVDFEGNETLSTRRLRRVMETKSWNIFAFLTGRGRLKDDVLEDDLERLRDFYREEGFLDIEISPDDITFDYLSDRHLVLRLKVREGRRYQVGKIEIAGNELYTAEELREELELRPGDWYGPSKMDDDVERLQDYYGKDGRLETEVQASRHPQVESTDIDIHYEIEESGQFFLESIDIEGNTKTKSVVIVRELGLGPGDVFNTVRMKTSQQRLRNTRFFEEVTLQPEQTEIPDRRDLKVTVREARTGNITFGAGFSSLERVIVFAELSQSNFDLFSPRSGFQGAGQKFRIRLQLGTRSNEILIDFEEPWLFQRQLALGFQIFRTETRYLASTYNELRTGFEVYLRKRLIELIDGRLSYRLEEVDIFNVRENAPAVIQEEERTVSKVGFSLVRDTRDSLLLTTRGNRLEFLSELAGGPLGADTDYYRLEFRGSQFVPLPSPILEDRDHVLSFLGRLGSVAPYGDSEEVPFFDRYFLGGPYSLRGFRFRDVGPRDPDHNEVVGGNSYGLFSAEYSFTIVDPLRFAFFYDAGFVNDDEFRFSTRDYNDNWGFGLRLTIMGAPLRLDYGIPITADEFNDTGGYFSFSFGTRF